MHKRKLGLVLGCLLILCCCCSASWWGAKSGPNNQSQTIEGNPLIGTAGYFPANFPSSTPTEIRDYLALVDQSTEIYGVHTTIAELGILDLALREQSNPIALVIGIPANSRWQENAATISDTLTPYLKQHARITHLALGNELNFDLQLGSPEFQDFVAAYQEIYSTLKTDFPQLNIFTTFQYETLIGKGLLTGKAGNPAWDLFTQLEPQLDVIGLTVYPYFDYANPAEIPSDYFAPVREYSSKPIAITETGWPTAADFGSPATAAYAGSAAEQVEYINKLAEIVQQDEFEFVNWLGIHDSADWQAAGPTVFNSLGLRYHNGEAKPSWAAWQEVMQEILLQ